MIKTLESDNFQIDKLGSQNTTIKVRDIGNTIIVHENELDELIEVLSIAKEEFFPNLKYRKLYKNMR